MTDTLILEKLDDLEPESVFDSKLLKIIRDLHFRICGLEDRTTELARLVADHGEELRNLRRRLERRP